VKEVGLGSWRIVYGKIVSKNRPTVVLSNDQQTSQSIKVPPGWSSYGEGKRVLVAVDSKTNTASGIYPVDGMAAVMAFKTSTAPSEGDLCVREAP
jgi:hypothetical protein